MLTYQKYRTFSPGNKKKMEERSQPGKVYIFNGAGTALIFSSNISFAPGCYQLMPAQKAAGAGLLAFSLNPASFSLSRLQTHRCGKKLINLKF
jgi:hypothetical protein